MKRISFLKSLLGGIAIVTSKPFTSPISKVKKKFTFDEIFNTWEGNRNLIYPKKDSQIYKMLEEIFFNKTVLNTTPVYVGVHSLQLPVKNKYTVEDFLPVKLYFESRYCENNRYALEQDVVFMFIKDTPYSMHLETFRTF